MKKYIAVALLVAVLAVFFAGCLGSNENPKAKIDVSPSGIVNTGQLVIFSGNGSNDPDGSISNYTWDFGDGTKSSAQWVGHRFAVSEWGTKKVKLFLVDNSGGTGDTSVDVSVNAAPNALYTLTPQPRQYLNYTGAQFYNVEDEIRFDGSTTTDPDTPSLNYSWDFGDSATSNQKVVFHRYTVGGNYTVKYVVKDGYAISEKIFNVTIQDIFFNTWSFSHYTDKDGYRFVNFTSMIKNNGTVAKEIGIVRLYLETFGASGPITGGQKMANNTYKIYEKSISTQPLEVFDVPISLSAITTVRATLTCDNTMMDFRIIQILP